MTSSSIAVVLVHGAFADATSWQHLIPLLELEGFAVMAVQNHLTCLSADIAATRRVIDAQVHPIVLVGHSYGGAVITGAAVARPRVKALVYVAAFAPDAGDTLNGLQSRFTPSALASAIATDSAGYRSIDRTRFREVFAGDVPVALSRVLAAAQKPIHGTVFDQTVAAAAWRNVPSWYLVASEDRVIHPELQRFQAMRIGARTVEVKTSHVPFISRPELVLEVIQEAARSLE